MTGFDVSGGRIRSVILEDGQRIPCAWAVNAAGAWAGEVCRLCGFTIPVAPLPRAVFYFETRAQVEGLPYVRDGLGLGFRPEGRGFISGVTDPDLAGDFCFDVNYDWFEGRVWPAFESTRLINAWIGHYAQCLFDGNMIIGAWPGEPGNFLIATGFSGHGLQHAPAVGRALSELILDRSFTTTDHSRLTARRILEDAPYAERGWKA